MNKQLAAILQNFPCYPCQLHPDLKLSFVCWQEDCNSESLVCPQCQYITHGKHNVKPLNSLLSDVYSDLVSTPNILEYASKIDLQMVDTIKCCGQLPASKQRQLIKSIREYYQYVQDIIRNYSQQAENILYSPEISKGQLEQFISTYTNYEKLTGKTNLEELCKQLLQTVKEKKEELQHALKTKQEFECILTLFVATECQKRKIKYQFSTLMKHISIEVKAGGLNALQSNNYSTNFVLVQPAITNKGKLKQKQSIQFECKNLLSWLSVGVAYKSFAEKANYYFNTGTVGHGGHLISNNGYSWHHSDISLNSCFINWTFTNNNIVTVTVDPKKKEIMFKKDAGEPYVLPFQAIKGEDMYFAAALSSHGQEVSIIQ